MSVLLVPPSSFMGGGDESEEGKKETVTVGTNETINIFSLASGHLYERFLRYNTRLRCVHILKNAECIIISLI